MPGGPSSESGARAAPNPTTALDNPDDWFLDAVGGSPSASGIRVTADKAMTYSAVWRAVSLISRDIGKLPLIVYKRDGDGKERDPSHPAYNLLKYRPNPWMAIDQFIASVMYGAILNGNGYAYVDRRGDGTPESLTPLISSQTSPIIVNGELWFASDIGPDTIKLPASDVIHIMGVTENGIVGKSMVAHMKDTIGNGLAASQYGGRFFSMDAAPGVVLEFPHKLQRERQIQIARDWNKLHQGLDRAHKTAVLTEGMKANRTSMTMEDAQFLDTRKFGLVEIANAAGVPAHKVGGEGRTAYASLEAEQRAYLDESLDPWLRTWELQCRDKLLSEPEKERDSHIIEFTRQALVRANLQARSEAYSKALGGAPWMTRDEVRARENLNPMGEGGDVVLDPLNMQSTEAGESEPAATSGDGENDEAADGQRAAMIQVAEDAVGRWFHRQWKYAERIRANPDRLREWLLSDKATDTLDRLTGELAMVCRAIGMPFATKSAHMGSDAAFGMFRDLAEDPACRSQADLDGVRAKVIAAAIEHMIGD